MDENMTIWQINHDWVKREDEEINGIKINNSHK